MTLGFVYLLLFLGGFLLAIVTGLARRLVDPSELVDRITAPSHEHWRVNRSPRTDLLVSFVTVFGLATFLAHGLAALSWPPEVGIGVVAGLVGMLLVRAAMGRCPEPDRGEGAAVERVTVVREIPANGFGQVEVELCGRRIKLAARSSCDEPLPVGRTVRILDRHESVVTVAPADDGTPVR